MDERYPCLPNHTMVEWQDPPYHPDIEGVVIDQDFEEPKRRHEEKIVEDLRRVKAEEKAKNRFSCRTFGPSYFGFCDPEYSQVHKGGKSKKKKSVKKNRRKKRRTSRK